jgi:hypothetical protein
VRGEDIEIFKSAASWVENLKAWSKQKKEGDLLAPTIREKMKDTAKWLMKAQTTNAVENLNETKIRFNKKGYGDWSQVIPKAQETRFKSYLGPAPTFNLSGLSVKELKKIRAAQKRNPTHYSAGYKKALRDEVNRRTVIQERGG